MKNRIALPDLMKGFAILMMVQVHIMELIMAPEVMESMAGKLSLFMGGVPAAPIFMAIMGYFVARSGKSARIIAFRGLKLIFWGFLLNIGLNFHLLILIFNGSINENPWQYIFGVDILFLAGVSLIFIAFIVQFLGKKVWVFLPLAFIIPLMAEFTPFVYESEGFRQYMMAFFISNVHWSYFPFFPWAGWVLAGYTFSLLESRYREYTAIKKYFRYTVYISLIPLFILLPWAIDISANLKVYYHHGIFFFIWGLFFGLLLFEIFRLFNQRLPKSYVGAYLQWLGRNVTAIYVLQWLIIGNLSTAIYRSQEGAFFWIFFAGIMAAASILVYLFNQMSSSHKKENLY